MAGYNRVILMGNLTRDPQLRYLPNNTAVCEFGIAANRRFRDRDGNQKEEVCFVDVTAWGRQAETINQYMGKGRPILVEGRLKFDQWTGQDGQRRSKLTVVAENFQFVGSREGSGGGGGGSYDQRSGPPQGGQSYDSPPQSGPESDYGAPEGEPPRAENIPF